MIIRYKIKYWDDCDKCVVKEGGLVESTNLGEAVNRIVDYYGEENICEISVYECENIIPDPEIKDFFKETD